jgi:hypothetical protein
MKRIGERALRDGLSVEYIRCSADSNSLDGVLLPEKGIAVVGRHRSACNEYEVPFRP